MSATKKYIIMFNNAKKFQISKYIISTTYISVASSHYDAEKI